VTKEAETMLIKSGGGKTFADGGGRGGGGGGLNLNIGEPLRHGVEILYYYIIFGKSFIYISWSAITILLT
jgi:hypothetical protein